ncbi:tRNA (adenosine(37)-N6)-threonylcarbamoyltransferase complex ATPase subunit type 1 TsaE [Siculibacillus lacustris]|uniref:tRNA threonylcarbamoyladenosine biosynthesis protein TsaE n=1 Tax=Siculibacillus lacustris TaxID=1549641 RepID=A0A4Q9VVW2_9HYPH|nr:tRNA (adenosine(37)-N6)-threonylcarbamoyltransferase complex ATPase subunit type 1 TsaE [Siculibacillus lacustris]TBW39213.1 tRNA (adenosine(37)-N6)-threonylcarbamoyltransferase complex ATPase subunit type 1 TsaE [Siculibacillus lacustris]
MDEPLPAALDEIEIRIERDLADESATVAFAEDLAAILRPGDVVALVGDLGAGKSTLARALIRAVADDAALEVPSPTFTLVQAYETARLTVAHFDLYRLADPDELDELGFDEAIAAGAVLVEWPDHAGPRLPDDALIVALAQGARPEARRLTVVGDRARWGLRLERSLAVRAFLAAAGHGAWHRRHLQGDASSRSYERLSLGAAAVVLMNHPPEPEDAAGRARIAARAAARLAEGPRPFLAFAHGLAAAGVRVPAVLAQDLDRGFLLLEDLGSVPCVAGMPPRPIPERYRAAVELLAELHGRALPDRLDDGAGGSHEVLRCDAAVLAAEVTVFLDWGLPHLLGRPAGADERARFAALWAPLFDEVLAAPATWCLRDYHSPNLLWLAHESGTRRVGVLDFQDTIFGPPAYDVVSLAQDARVDVSPELEAELIAAYVAARRASAPDFNEAAFRRAYAILAAQRNTRILGVFARLDARDGKPQYLAHRPRLWAYLDRVLDEPVLRPLKLWYEEAVPRERRAARPPA